MKLYLFEAAQIQRSPAEDFFSNQPSQTGLLPRPADIFHCAPQSQSNKRQVLLFASMRWDVIIVEKRHNLKSKDYSFRKLQSDKLTLWN